jgi:hypothetical protein
MIKELTMAVFKMAKLAERIINKGAGKKRNIVVDIAL